MTFNYSQICFNLLKQLPDKQRDVISRRFGLGNKTASRETLEAIGKSYQITRERVRQIERDGILKLKSELKQYQNTLNYFEDFIKKLGGLKKENLLLEQLGGQKEKNQVYFLLTLAPNFERYGESEDFHPFWTINKSVASLAPKIILAVYNKLKKAGKLLSLDKIVPNSASNKNNIISYLEISKKIQPNPEGLFGLKIWPEINPRGVKDRAYLVFKKENKPLHFNQVASLIGKALGRDFPLPREISRPNPQTVHNELIKDPRFILVGRGLYALQEWGYTPGCVKDVIAKVLKESKKLLTKEEILARVLKQRFVKENTVFLNLSNKKYFFKNNEGYYKIREA